MRYRTCPGKYCGRTLLPNGSFTECGACPRGFRVITSFNVYYYVCGECHDPLAAYDWLYLGFMCLFPYILHLYFIESKRRSCQWRSSTTLFISSTLETILAALLTVLLVHPIGSLNLYCCRSEQLSDWYTMFYNPNPNYEDTIYCTTEAVYPLQSIVFVFNGISIVLMLILRPLLSCLFKKVHSHRPTYAALYFFPVLSLVHAIFSGLIYYTFPYITLFLSIIILVCHFALQKDQHWLKLIYKTVTRAQNLAVVLILWLIHAYGIVSLIELLEIGFHPMYLLLVPMPTFFYIFTTSVSDPVKMYNNYY